MMDILIAGETSGTVRDVFIAAGYNAISCDILPTAKPGPHIQADVLTVLHYGWDMMIAHPDCTYLTNSAEWAFNEVQTKRIKPGTLIGAERWKARMQAVEFADTLYNAPIEKICIENPPGYLSKVWGKATQYIQPYDYGHDASKKTGLWLKGLEPIEPVKPYTFVKPRMVCKQCKGVSPYDAAFNKGCIHCGAEAGLLLPRWGNQTDSGQNRLPPSDDRWQLRSNFWEGVAVAMAVKWGINL